MFATAEKPAEKPHVNGKARSIHRTASKASRRIEDDADDAVSTIYDAAAAIKDDVESLAHSAGQRMRAVLDDAQSNVSEVRGNMTSVIRENPFQSLLGAIGVGIVLGFIARR